MGNINHDPYIDEVPRGIVKFFGVKAHQRNTTTYYLGAIETSVTQD